ncbi:sugar ABC transporter ATP-binding protein [candidate division KSB1 bacterium]|nr:sugar ABC transporter ATP-binding protein [candidate division KSB1 bacterium]
MTKLLAMKKISKSYPGVQALDQIDFDLNAGEVHALVGENGAGKSTLMKILAGAETRDSGQIEVAGQAVHFLTPHDSKAHGIALIYQEFNLIPELTAAENIFLGIEPRKSIFINRKKLYADAAEILNRIGVEINLYQPVKNLSVAQQQIIEIAKSLTIHARIIAMDEPSATLTRHELHKLFELIRKLKADGLGIIYISHRLEEIFQIADRVTVFRDGQHIATQPIQELNKDKIIKLMVGRTLEEEFPKKSWPRGRRLLQIKNLNSNGTLRDINFELFSGEILGITGLVGAGRTELARAIFGADPVTHKEIYLHDQFVTINSPQAAIRHGIGLLTEDRKNQGLVLGMAIYENISLTNLKAFIRGGFIQHRRELQVARKYMEEIRIKAPNEWQLAKNLSGGNQQKVVVAKWLFSQSKIIIFDEPTRGIDVGAKVEIYHLMTALVEKGIGVIMISSELPEILGLCDRILVMHSGQIRGELTRAEATQEKIMYYATGEK